MKKLLLILLCLPMIFSCGEKKIEKDVKENNAEKRNNTEKQINTIKIFDGANTEGECNLSKYFIYLVNELNNLAENTNEESVTSMGLKSKRRAKSLINEMLNAADWGRQNGLDISTMRKCKEFIENESLFDDKLLEEFYKEMYKELINERVPSTSPTNQQELEIISHGRSIGWNDNQCLLAVKQNRKNYKSKTRKDRKNFNSYLWSYE